MTVLVFWAAVSMFALLTANWLFNIPQPFSIVLGAVGIFITGFTIAMALDLTRLWWTQR